MASLRYPMMIALLLAGAACQQPAAEASDAQEPPVAIAQTANTAGTDGADDRPVRTMTESDRLWLETARGSCDTGDFNTFLRAFGGSWAVREKYSAAKIGFGEEGQGRPMPQQQYLNQNNFPITPIDWEWGTADSYRNFEANGGDSTRLRYVQVTVETASDNRRRVEWVPGRFEAQLENPPEELQEGLGRMVEQTGPGGYLLFYPTSDCWELVEDIAYPR